MVENKGASLSLRENYAKRTKKVGCTPLDFNLNIVIEIEEILNISIIKKLYHPKLNYLYILLAFFVQL